MSLSLALLLASSQPATAGVPRVDVCHTSGPETWHPVTVAARGVRAHLAHGDWLVDDEVAGDGIDNDCDGLLDCEDDDLTGVYDGDVYEADVAGLCEGWCERTVTGSVFIQDTTLTDLAGLACVTDVEGDVWIEANAHLVSLDGLEKLERVGGAMSVGLLYCEDQVQEINCFTTGNAALERIDSLGALQYVGNWLSFGGNGSLTTIADLDSLESVGSISGGSGGLWFDDNSALVTLPAVPMLTRVDGWLTVWGSDALTSLGGLETVEEVTGIVVIHRDDRVDSLEPLGGLTSVGGMWVQFNPALVGLEGLEGLSAAPQLWLSGNTALASLESLGNLRSVEYLFVSGSPALASLHGLEGLTSLGDLILYDNDGLASLDALGGITEVRGLFYLVDNDGLVDLSGLDNLASVGWDFNVGDSDALLSLHGLESLRSIGGWLFIGPFGEAVGNDVLADLGALHGLEAVAGDVVITCDPALSPAEVDALVAEIDTIGGAVLTTGCE